MTHSNFKSDEALELPQEARHTKSNAFRYGAMLPIAAVMTLGLTLTMAALIATEFTPQDITETAEFEINPKIEPILVPVRTVSLDPLKDVVVPPAPPKLDIVQTTAVELPFRELEGEKTEFDMPDIDFSDGFDAVEINKHPTPTTRIPPVFPPRFLQGDVSGYCRVRFDVSPEGQPYNVSATLCTNSQLMAPTVKSVKRWRYTPEILNGRPVSHSGLETIIRFDLQDERGATLPVPAGY